MYGHDFLKLNRCSLLLGSKVGRVRQRKTRRKAGRNRDVGLRELVNLLFEIITLSVENIVVSLVRVRALVRGEYRAVLEFEDGMI